MGATIVCESRLVRGRRSGSAYFCHPSSKHATTLAIGNLLASPVDGTLATVVNRHARLQCGRCGSDRWIQVGEEREDNPVGLYAAQDDYLRVRLSMECDGLCTLDGSAPVTNVIEVTIQVMIG